MIPDEQTAGICGLFCGVCPIYPAQCHGCHSDTLAAHCQVCPPGFRACAREHGVTWCFECAEFPCARLEGFLDAHWENGISHHAGVIASLERMKAVGVAAWVKEETAKAQCGHCGQLTPWNRPQCPCRKQRAQRE